MSRSAFYPFNPSKPDGHKVKYDMNYQVVSVYCPIARDHVSATSTSIGVKCNHCQRIIS